MSKSSCPAPGDVPPTTSGNESALPSRTSVGRRLARRRHEAVHRTHISGEVTPEESELRPRSDQNPGRTGRRGTRLIRSRRRQAYDSVGVPNLPGPPRGDAASRAQAVAPIATAPMTAKTCRQTSDVMVRPERPNVAW